MEKKHTRRIMLGLLALIIGVMGWRWVEAENPQEEQQLQAVAVSTAVVKSMEKPAVMPLSGTVEGLTSSIISSRFSGQVANVLVEDGQQVEKGQPLFVLDDVELRNSLRVAQNNVNQTKAKYDNNRDEFQRSKTLFSQGAYSQQQLETARTKMLASQAEYDSARANLASAQKQVAEATVVSPAKGVIAHKNLTNGQNVSAGSQLMTVEQLDSVHVVINVEQRDMAFLKMGDRVEIALDTYPDEKFVGNVHVISPVAGKESRMFRVKIKVDNPDFLLRPGMFVQVQLNLGQPKQVLAVPQQALLGQKGLQYLFTLEEGKARRIRVEAGDILGDYVEITQGATEGMIVLLDNLDKLKDGDLVQTGEE